MPAAPVTLRMKSRLLVLAVLAVAAAALYFGIARPPTSTLPKHLRDPMAELRPAIVPPLEPPPLTIPPVPTIEPPALRPAATLESLLNRPEIAIQDRTTIDFSSGAPVVRSAGKDAEELDRTLEEMADAAKKTSFKAKKTGEPESPPK